MKMKLAGTFLALAGITGALLGQEASTKSRPLTLQECLQLAVTHNLDVQIERLNPQISLYDLKAAYGGYDPMFSLSGSHDHSESGSQFLGAGVSLPGSTTDSDSFNSSVNGLLPWGTTYNLGTRSPIQDRYGTSTRAEVVDDPTRPIFSTNSFVNINNGELVTYITTNYAKLTVPRSDPFESSDGAVGLTVTQPLLKNFLMNNTQLSIKVGKNRLKWSEFGFKQRLIGILTLTEQAYYDLIYSREFVKVQEKAVELAARLLAENKKRVEVGAMAPLDEKQAESQAASSRADLLAAQNSLAIQEHALKNLITDQYSQWADVSVEPSEPLQAPKQFFDRQDSWGKGLVERPDLAQAKLDLEQSGLQLKYARNQLLPELDIFASYGFNGTGTEFSGALDNIARMDAPYYRYGGQITIPLSNTSARNNLRARRAMQEQALLSVKRLEQQILVQIDDAIRQAQSSFERVDATRAARQYAEAALEAEQKKLESGKSTSFQVLQLQRDLTTARGNEIRALADYNKALATLSQSEGMTLQRHKISLQVK